MQTLNLQQTVTLQVENVVAKREKLDIFLGFFVMLVVRETRTNRDPSAETSAADDSLPLTRFPN